MKNWSGAHEGSCGNYVRIHDVILELASGTSKVLTEWSLSFDNT